MSSQSGSHTSRVTSAVDPFLVLLEEIGVSTGLDVDRMLVAGRRAEEVLGQRLRSNVIRSGPVIHTESSPEKEPGRLVAAAGGSGPPLGAPGSPTSGGA